jgi:hypothetical protein
MIQIDDGTVNATAFVNASLVVRNSPQNISDVTLNSTLTYNKSDEDISLWLRATDVDNETTFRVHTRWFNHLTEDTTLQSTINTSLDVLTNVSTVTAGNLTAGSNWTAMVRTYDGDLNSSFLNYTISIGDGDLPGINFSDNTPGNDSTLTVAYAEINISINETNLDELSFYWNNTNYTMFNESTQLLMNFDNRSELDENGSIVKDFSKYNNNGTVVGAVVNTTNCISGNCYTLDGTNDYIQIPENNGDLDIRDNFTLMAWVHVTGSGSGEDNQYVINKQNVYSLFIEDDERVTFYDGGGTTTTDTINLNQWHHIAATYSSGASSDQLKIFIDGKVSTTGSENAPVSVTDQPLRIGCYTNSGGACGSSWGFQGNIDEPMIINRTLSEVEMLQYYKSRITKLNTTHWNFFTNQTVNEDESYNYSATATDTAGNSNQTEMRTLTGPAGNTAPTINQVLINSSALNNRTNESISCWLNATDSDSDTINAYVRWFNLSSASTTAVENADHTDIRNVTNEDNKIVLVDTLNFGNTTKNQNWTCMIQIDDGTVNATAWINSSTMNITNTPPEKPLPDFPIFNSTITNRTTHFNWTAVGDLDNDTITYDLYIERVYCGDINLQCDTELIEVNDLTGNNYTITDVLDVDSRYNWSVNATTNDETVISDEFNFTLNSLLSLTLTTSTVDFGTMDNGVNNDTLDFNPHPFVVENSGNVVANITLNASSPLFTSSSATFDTYFWQFAVANSTAENASFNWTGSQTSFENVSNNEIQVIRELNWSDNNDSAFIHFNITVPEDELAGEKSTNVVLTARWWTNATS